MFWNGSRRWSYRILVMLLGLWVAVILSLCSLFFDYEQAFSAGHAEHILPANAEAVRWGYFSQMPESKLVIDSGTVETLTHHANDDAESMVLGDQEKSLDVAKDKQT